MRRTDRRCMEQAACRGWRVRAGDWPASRWRLGACAAPRDRRRRASYQRALRRLPWRAIASGGMGPALLPENLERLQQARGAEGDRAKAAPPPRWPASRPS
ncbi:MAG: hypothetical protein MZW92_42995 [Comamonadaceae bacterium]|nr:hypothetical protein [Comamonadaceae bacterium]